MKVKVHISESVGVLGVVLEVPEALCACLGGQNRTTVNGSQNCSCGVRAVPDLCHGLLKRGSYCC